MSKMIAVCGSPGSGKTTAALKIAQELYYEKKGTILFLSPDINVPVMAFIFPHCKDSDLFSIGKALDHIDTAEQLSIYRGNTEEKISELTKQRQKIRNRLRRCSDESEISRLKARVSEYSSEITRLRREIKYCNNIAERSGILKEKLSLIYEREKSERKDERKNEQFR